MQDFRINEYLIIRLENNKTIIYINEERFDQCRFLLLNIPIDHIAPLDEIQSIDEAAEELSSSLEQEGMAFELGISPEVQFWAHSSNLQVWAENGYDTRLLHSNLSFPLLKKLTQLGDPLAKKVFSEEIAKRIERGYFPVIEYLINEGYLNYLQNEEFITLVESSNFNIHSLIEKYYESELSYKTFKIYKLVERIKVLPSKDYLNLLKDLYLEGNIQTIIFLEEHNFESDLSRKNYYHYILEKNDGKIMLELENLLNLKFPVEFTCTGETGLGIAIKDRRVVEMNIYKPEMKRFLKPILKLKALRNLIFYCQIKSLPADIDELSNLEELTLAEDVAIPKSIKNIKSLRILTKG